MKNRKQINTMRSDEHIEMCIDNDFWFGEELDTNFKQTTDTSFKDEIDTFWDDEIVYENEKSSFLLTDEAIDFLDIKPIDNDYEKK